ncbi:ankyrin, partial [Melanomma pulvis-pyrius CBS 109.77]
DERKEETALYPLHNACLQGHVSCVKLLVEKGGMDTNALDNLGCPPLMYAGKNGSFETVQWLLSQGADPTFRLDSGPSILFLVAESGNIDTLELLLD